ncbi:MerR family transcriptional regulator [Pedobacter sp. N23S346]|uniref:MerR family transcriptional regulator n=1 Tax=Pedobacter sp. N23S346 TaxID=3402750 RepID=UPI003AC131D3
MSYTISDLEKLSGIQSHTIRIWEHRYNALNPHRSQGNTRLYDDGHLKKLLDIVSLNESGFKISKICSLSDQAVEKLLDEQHNYPSNDKLAEFYISRLIRHGISYNEYEFNLIIEEGFQKLGIAQVYRRVIYPLLVRLGIMWRKNHICPAHEHFIANIIRKKLFAAINDITPPTEDNTTWLLFLPEDEDHEIGLLFADYMLRLNKQKVIFLGSKVPIDSIKNVFSTINIDHVLFFFVRTRLPDIAQKYIAELSEVCKSAQIHLAGNQQVISKLKHIDHINCLQSLDDFEFTIQHPTI